MKRSILKVCLFISKLKKRFDGCSNHHHQLITKVFVINWRWWLVKLIYTLYYCLQANKSISMISLFDFFILFQVSKSRTSSHKLFIYNLKYICIKTFKKFLLLFQHYDTLNCPKLFITLILFCNFSSHTFYFDKLFLK